MNPEPTMPPLPSKPMRPLLPLDPSIGHEGAAADWERALGPLRIDDIQAANCYLANGYEIAYGGLFKRAAKGGPAMGCGRTFVLLQSDPELAQLIPDKERIANHVRIEHFEGAWTVRFLKVRGAKKAKNDTPPSLTLPLPKLEDNPKEFAFAFTRYLSLWDFSREDPRDRR